MVVIELWGNACVYRIQLVHACRRLVIQEQLLVCTSMHLPIRLWSNLYRELLIHFALEYSLIVNITTMNLSILPAFGFLGDLLLNLAWIAVSRVASSWQALASSPALA